MPRLEWDGRNCTNPPEGWEIEVCEYNRGFYWHARQPVESGSSYIGSDAPTEAEARRACEAALLRLGVLEPSEEDEVAAMQKFSKFADDRSIKAIVRALAALEVETEHV